MTRECTNGCVSEQTEVPEPGSFPQRVTIEFTNHCNVSCVMCPRHHMQGPKGYLDYSLFCRLADEIAEHEGTALVPFFRGESLMHPEAVAMLRYAKRKGIAPIQLATNATLLTRETAEALVDLKIDFISFSVDSIDPETYRAIRRGAELEKVLKNIEALCDARRRKGNGRPQIQVSVVNTRGTAAGITDFVDYWSERVDRVRVYEEHSQGGSFGALEKDDERREGQGRQPCLKPFGDLVVYWDGSVALCNHDWDRKEALGNVKTHSIEEVWCSEAYQRVRESHLGRGAMETLCQGCDHWEAYYRDKKVVGELYEL